MPAPCTTDWPAVRATAIALNSIKEAAELHKVSYDAAKMRASREAWPVGRRPAKAVQSAEEVNQAQLAKINPKSVTSVTSTADALTSVLVNDERETRMSLSKATRKAARAVEGLPGVQVFGKARSLKDLVSSAAQLHGWGERGGEGGPDINILSIGGNVNLGK